jgi:hemolysin activation/secretion protein
MTTFERTPSGFIFAVILAVGLWAAPAAPLRAQGTAPPSVPVVTVYHFKRLIFAGSLKTVTELKPAPDAGPIVVRDVAVLAGKEFETFLAPYVDRAITTQSVNQLAKDVSAYVRKHDRLVVNVLMPNQDISAGQFRMAVIIGHYSELKFKGNRYFSDKLLEAKLGVKPGDEVRLSTLESAVSWANANPFRHVEVLVNTVNKQPGIADLDVAVQEHFPVRFSVSYDDSGNDLIGNNHYTAGVQFGNLWGLDHQASYQYTTTDDTKVYQAHSFDYRIPLPWHHYLVFDAAYAVVQPSFAGGLFNEVGENLITDARYIIPFQAGTWKFESATGVDFKRINNNLLFGGSQVLSSADDIAQLTQNISGGRPDRLGAWGFALNLDFSPGGFNSRNSNAAFGAARYGANSRYAYGTFVGQRRLDLPLGFQSFSKAIVQAASTNLLSSEELTIGGQATVRGYDELLFSGDQGVVLSEELQGPVWQKHLPFLPKKWVPLSARPLLFLDYGRVAYKHVIPSDITLPPLLSAGVGLRANLSTNFSLSFDYGWQILDYLAPGVPQPDHCRSHIRVSLAY